MVASMTSYLAVLQLAVFWPGFIRGRVPETCSSETPHTEMSPKTEFDGWTFNRNSVQTISLLLVSFQYLGWGPYASGGCQEMLFTRTKTAISAPRVQQQQPLPIPRIDWEDRRGRAVKRERKVGQSFPFSPKHSAGCKASFLHVSGIIQPSRKGDMHALSRCPPSRRASKFDFRLNSSGRTSSNACSRVRLAGSRWSGWTRRPHRRRRGVASRSCCRY